MAAINTNVASAPSVITTFPRVHLEIMEQVIDMLNADANIDAVKACSQTCKALLPRCRAHIFSSIDLDPALSACRYTYDDSDEDDGDETQTSTVSHTRRIPLFLNLIDRTPEIAFYVQELNLVIRQKDSNSPRIICALNLLSNLTSFNIGHDNPYLNVSSLDWHGLSPIFISAIHRIISSPKLKKLGFASISNFPLSIFSLCPGIKNLSLWGIRPVNSKSPPPMMTPILLQILSCDEDGICLVERTLMRSKHPILDLTQLQQLTALFYEERGNASMKEVLSTSESLVKVDLHGTSHFIYLGIAQSIASRSLATFQSFQLSTYTPSHSDRGSKSIRKICAELQVLSDAPNLQHISISLSLTNNYRFRTGVLLALDRLLTGPGFPRVGSVGLHLSAAGGRGDFKSAMEAVIREEFVGLSQSAHRTFESSVTVRNFLELRFGRFV